MKLNISKEQVANIVSNLAASIEKLNIPLIDISETADPLSDLERMHSDIVEYLNSNEGSEF